MNDTASHVILNGMTKYMECKHCGASKHLALPMPMRDAALQMMEFSKLHSNCPAPADVEVTHEKT